MVIQIDFWERLHLPGTGIKTFDHKYLNHTTVESQEMFSHMYDWFLKWYQYDPIP